MTTDDQQPIADLAHLLNEIVAFIRRYVVLGDEQADAAALWIVHTHIPDALGISPYLSITSAEKGSGKTLLLEVLEPLVARPWYTGSVSGATLARKIDSGAVTGEWPTLLLDESDAAFKGDKEYAEALRGILNTGFRASGRYTRCVGANGTSLTTHDFSTFCPKAIAGIGQLPDTVADRSIPIRLKRKTTHEKVERFRSRKTAVEAEPLRQAIEQWTREHGPRSTYLELSEIEQLPDRANDIWEPLLGVAHLASAAWAERARNAAMALSGRAAVEDESLGVRLLADVRSVFEEQSVDRLSSVTLLDELHKIEESPWGAWKGGPFTGHVLSRLLKPFGIKTMAVWVDGQTVRGYKREQFEDDWHRYLPVPPVRAVRNVRSGSASDAAPNAPNAPNAWKEVAAAVRLRDQDIRPLLKRYRPAISNWAAVTTQTERRQLAASQLVAEAAEHDLAA